MKKALIGMFILLLLGSFAGCKEKQPEPEIVRPVRGYWTELRYTNDYLGVVLSLQEEGWSALSSAELADMADVDIEDMAEEGEEYSDAMMAVKRNYEIFCADDEMGLSMMIVMENLSFSGAENHVTEELYFEAMRVQVQEDSAANSTAAAAVTFGEVYEQIISGNSYKVMQAYYAETGTTQYYCARRVDSYMGLIVISVPAESDVNAIWDMFQ